jgi:MoxR-like ATPase
MVDSRLSRASERFRLFFGELSEAFVEREDALAQIALALLGREHVLMTGPPGTAKSKLARAVLGRIVDERTGETSLFSRQFTEDMVTSDLYGAVDFKTLTETGRTEHFLDEGMAGYAHALLDEVLDGREMLLRSTLGLLNERELKQGRRVIPGKIEVALMTTNRYLSEVLQESRQALLAFIDRVAYLSFVPKGFASTDALKRVMRAQLTGVSAPRLDALLTLQDLDLLQDATRAVYVAPELSDRLVDFLRVFEEEVGATLRADPEYTPSRYLSTRTQVRAGQALKSIAVYNRIFTDPERPLEALPADLEKLRLLLLLSGPSLQDIGELLRRQDDPRERQQLHVIGTERAIFDACLARLDRSPLPRREARGSAALDEARLRGSSVPTLLGLLGELCEGPVTDPGELARAVRGVWQRVAEQGLRADGELGDVELEEHLESLTALIERVDPAGPLGAVREWLSQQALKVLGAQICRRAIPDLRAELTGAERPFADVVEQVDALLERLGGLFEVRDRLARSVRSRSGTEFDADRLLEEDVTNRVRRAFLADIGRLADGAPGEASAALATLRERLGVLERLHARCEQTFRRPSTLLSDVAGPHLRAMLERSLAGLEQTPRQGVLEALDGVLAALAGAGALRYAATAPLLVTAMRALLAEECEAQREAAAADLPSEQSVAAYRRLRASLPRASLAYMGAQLCLRLDPTVTPQPDEASTLAGLGARLAALPPEVLMLIEDYDARRVERPLRYIEGWWRSARLPPTPRGRLDALAESGLIDVLREECALERFRSELSLARSLFPAAAAPGPLLERIAELQRELGLLQQEVGREISEALGIQAATA